MCRKFTKLLVAIVLIAFTSCNDYDQLKSDLTELEKQVEELEQLQDEIDRLEGELNDLENMVSEIDAELAEVVETINEDINAIWDDLESDDIYWGDVATAAQFDEIAAGDYVKVSGKVIISSAAQAEKIASIGYIGGDLYVSNVNALSLNNLEVVGGSLRIYDIEQEASTLSFPKLISIGDKLTTVAFSVNGLKSVDMPALSLVAGDVNIDLGQDYNTYNSLEIFNVNPSVVGGDYILKNADAIQTISTSAIEYIEGDFNLSSNESLMISTIDITKVQKVGGSIVFEENFQGGFGGLSTSGEQATASALDFFPALEVVGEDIRFSSSTDVLEISGLSNLTQMGGDLFIYGDYTVVDFAENITEIEGNVTVEVGLDENSVIGFSSITNIGGYLRLAGNEVAGFSKLESLAIDKSDYDADDLFINAGLIPTFESLNMISYSFGGVINLVLFGELNTGVFPALMNEGLSVNIAFESRGNDDYIEPWSVSSATDDVTSIEISGFANITSLNEFTTYIPSTVNATIDAFTAVEVISNKFDVQAEADDVDLSNFEAYFIYQERVPRALEEYNEAQDAYYEEVEKYNLEWEEWNNTPEDERGLEPEYPQYPDLVYPQETSEMAIYLSWVEIIESMGMKEAFMHVSTLEESDFND